MKTHVIIGTAAAGIGCLNTLIRLDSHSRIICISDEIEQPYNKCFLADYVQKVKQEDELCILRNEILENSNVRFMRGTRVIAIDRHAQTITLHDQTMLSYDTLFIGTGSSPFMPQISGIDVAQGVFTFHSLADVHQILAYAKDFHVQRVAIIGGGLSGLECADSLHALNFEVTVIERSEQVLARQVDQEGGQLIKRLMARCGVELLSGLTVQEIKRNESRVCAIKIVPQQTERNKVNSVKTNENVSSVISKEKKFFSSPRSAKGLGDFLPTHMLIIATGLKPNVELAQQAGLTLRDGYIGVDEYMRTSDPSIFAGGDCVTVYDQVTRQYAPSCTWPDAMQQGSVAAQNMISPQFKKYHGSCVITSSTFFGTSLVTCGPVAHPPAGAEIRVSRGDDFYHKIILVGGKVCGYLLIGNTQVASKLKRALLTGQKI